MQFVDDNLQGGQAQRIAPKGQVACRIIVFVLLIWIGVTLFAGLVSQYDESLRGHAVGLAGELFGFFLIFLPFMLQSVGLALHFKKKQESALLVKHLMWILILLLVVYLPLVAVYQVVRAEWRANNPIQDWRQIWQQIRVIGVWLYSMIILFALSAQVSYSYWQKNRHQLEAANQARQQVLSLKLLHLQGQLEPYFLLHSLDGIEALVNQADRALATRAMARLSDLLRYVLESQQEDYLSLADEIAFVKEYLNLQNLRFDNRLEVQWDLGGSEWTDYLSPPLLLHPLIEFAMRNMETMLEKGGALIRIQCALIERHIHVLVVFCGESEQKMLWTQELEAAKERMYLMYGHTGFIQTVRNPQLTGNIVSPHSSMLRHAVMLAFPVKETADV